MKFSNKHILINGPNELVLDPKDYLFLIKKFSGKKISVLASQKKDDFNKDLSLFNLNCL